jgi:ribosomal protein S18 acetylase RimI-like enzyme
VVAYVAGDYGPAGIARLVVDEDDPTVADAACAVADRYHALGVGTALMRALVRESCARGIIRLRATILAENTAALALLRKVGTFEHVTVAAGELEVVASLACGVEPLLRAA